MSGWSGSSFSGMTYAEKQRLGGSTEEFNPDDILPDFIDSFVKYYYKFYEVVPEEYIEACAMFAMSAIIGNSLSCNDTSLGYKKCNLLVILLGPSSVGHKSMIVTETEKMLKATDKVTFLSSRFSIEAMISDLKDAPSGVFVRDEFTGMMAEATKSYLSDLKEFLCQIYDCRVEPRSTKKEGRIDPGNICNSLLSATVPENLSLKLTIEDSIGGFLPRIVWICPDFKEQKDIGIKRATDKDMEFKFKLVKTLMFIHKKFLIDGTDARLTDEAFDVYNRWILNNSNTVYTAGKDVMAYYARLVDFLLKVAMIMQVSSTATEVQVKMDNKTKKVTRYIEIQASVMRKAVKWINEYRDVHLNRALKMLSNRENERVYNGIKTLLEETEQKEITYSMLLRKLSDLSTDRLRKVVQTLIDADRIRVRASLRDVGNIKKKTEHISIVKTEDMT